MRKRTPRRSAAAGVALTALTFAIGLILAVLVAGSASAKTSPKTSPKKPAPKSQAQLSPPPAAVAPADKFSAINGTVNAASDHEIVGSSAFPNFTTGAVDNYYSLSHAHVDNSPFAEGTASPADTGPVGQTAAAGNTQQPQYADARWPGGPDNATYGNQGGPYASSAADNNRATADASEPSNSFRGPGPGGTETLAVPKGFDDLLQKALAAWNSKWDGRLGMTTATPKATTPVAPVTVPSAPVKPPSVTVTTPNLPVGGVDPAPSVTVPSPNFASAGPKDATRSPAAVTLPQQPSLPALPSKGSAPSPGGTESSLKSSTLATLVYKTDESKPDTSASNTCKSDTVGTTGTATTTTKVEKPKSGSCTLALSGESSMGKVTIGDGQIVIEGIHVTASITNDGTKPSYEAAVSVASATIGGVPVTIDEDGVHVAGQGGGLPYKQASDGLNSALNKAGIQIFLVAPEVTDCSQTGTGTGGGTSTTTTSTTTSPDQSGGTSSCGQTGTSNSSCDQSGTSTGGGSGLPAPPTSAPTPSQTTTTQSPCGQGDMGASCDQTGTGADGTGSSGGTGALPGTSTTTKTTTTTTTTGYQSSTTTTPGSCGQSGTTPSSSMCTKAGKATGTKPGSTDQSATTSTTSSSNPMSGSTFQFGPGPGTNNAGEETVTATGVHIVFTQPVSPPGVPAQYVEHILGEVFVDSLATPAAPLANIPFSSGSSLSSSCLGSGHFRSAKSGSGLSAGGSSSLAGGSASSGSLVASGSSLGSSSQPSATPTTGNSLPARFASALHKPLWLLLAYVVWQLIVIGTGWSLWNWRRGGAS